MLSDHGVWRSWYRRRFGCKRSKGESTSSRCLLPVALCSSTSRHRFFVPIDSNCNRYSAFCTASCGLCLSKVHAPSPQAQPPLVPVWIGDDAPGGDSRGRVAGVGAKIYQRAAIVPSVVERTRRTFNSADWVAEHAPREPTPATRIPVWRVWLGDEPIGDVLLPYGSSKDDEAMAKRLFPEAMNVWTTALTSDAEFAPYGSGSCQDPSPCAPDENGDHRVSRYRARRGSAGLHGIKPEESGISGGVLRIRYSTPASQPPVFVCQSVWSHQYDGSKCDR